MHACFKRRTRFKHCLKIRNVCGPDDEMGKMVSLEREERKKECLHQWVRVDQAGRPLPPKTLVILVGSMLKHVSLCIIISIIENIWTLCFILENFCLVAWKYMFDRC